MDITITITGAEAATWEPQEAPDMRRDVQSGKTFVLANAEVTFGDDGAVIITGATAPKITSDDTSNSVTGNVSGNVTQITGNTSNITIT